MSTLLQNAAIQHLIAGLASLGVLGGLLASGVNPNDVCSSALIGVIGLLVGSTATNLGANSTAPPTPATPATPPTNPPALAVP